jgi:hypothetical protein
MATTQTLKDQGWRFVLRAGEFRWTHPLEIQSADVDVTDLDDDAFEAFVRENTAAEAA